MPYHVLTNTEPSEQILAMLGDDCLIKLWTGCDTDPPYSPRPRASSVTASQNAWRNHGHYAQTARDQQSGRRR